MKRQLRLTGLGLLNEVRNPAARKPALAAAAVIGVIALTLRDVPVFASLALADWVGRAYGVAGALWIAGRAERDFETASAGGQLFRSKPADSGSSALVLWLTGGCYWLLLLCVGLFPAVVLLGLLGGAVGLIGQLIALGKAAAVVTLSLSFAFVATRVFRSRTAGLVFAGAWLLLEPGLRQAGVSPYLAQNLLAWIALAVVAVAACSLLLERRRRDELQRPAAVAGLLGLLCLPVAGGAALSYQDLAPHSASERNYWTRVGNQRLRLGHPIPGLGIRDPRYPELSSSGRPGEVTFVYFYAAEDGYAVGSLNALRQLQREMGERGVRVLGVCFTPDKVDGWLYSQIAPAGFPIGVVDRVREGSGSRVAMMTAFAVHKLPLLVVTDRRRNVREIRYDRRWDVDSLRELAQSRIAEEPR